VELGSEPERSQIRSFRFFWTWSRLEMDCRDASSAAYADAYAVRLAAQHSVVTKNCSTSPHQRRAAWSSEWQKF